MHRSIYRNSQTVRLVRVAFRGLVFESKYVKSTITDIFLQGTIASIPIDSSQNIKFKK